MSPFPPLRPRIALLGLLAVLTPLLTPAGLRAQSAVYSSQLRLAGQVQNRRTLTLDDLQAFPAAQANVTFSAGNTPRVSAAYTGVLLWDLLTEAKLVTIPAVKNDLLRRYVVATGSDGYQVVLSLAELSPDFGGQQVLVAYAQNGQPLDAGSGGFARLIVPGDKAGGRNVSNLVSIKVHLGVPPPATGQ